MQCFITDVQVRYKIFRFKADVYKINASLKNTKRTHSFELKYV